MVLLDAMASVFGRGGEIAAIATFDHGTGAAARRACRLVERTAMERSIPVVSGRMTARADATEADWRAERWRFLNAWAEELRATVVTAHTQDDQLETVVLRLLRGSGVRGLAAMQQTGPIVRPLLDVRRATIAAYARICGVPLVEDPSNRSRAHQRNRVRLDLIPALERAQPGFSAWCLDLAARASELRAAVEAVVDDLGPTVSGDGSLALRAAPVSALRPTEWGVLWPALAGRVSVTMDRRGIERAAAWAPRAAPGSHIPLSGDAEIARTGTTFVIRRRAPGTTSGDADYILNA